MKHALAFCLCLLLLMVGAPAHAASSPEATIIRDRTPGYGIAGAQHTVLAYFAKGATLDVVGRSNDRKWLQVTNQEKAIWIASDSASLNMPIRRIKTVRPAAPPKVPARADCTVVKETDGFAEGGLPDALIRLRDGSCVQLNTKAGQTQIWLWHPAGSTIKLSAFAPVLLRYGPWGLRLQNLYGKLMYVNWATDKQDRPLYISGTAILQRKDILYYELTPLFQEQRQDKLLLLNDVHVLERIQ